MEASCILQEKRKENEKSQKKNLYNFGNINVFLSYNLIHLVTHLYNFLSTLEPEVGEVSCILQEKSPKKERKVSKKTT